MVERKFGAFSKVRKRQDAIELARSCAWGLGWVAFFNAMLSPFVGFALLMDAALFAIVAYLIHAHLSRIAAVAALVLSIAALARLVIMKTGTAGHGFLLRLVIVFLSVRAIEATFKLQGSLKGSDRPAASPSD